MTTTRVARPGDHDGIAEVVLAAFAEEPRVADLVEDLHVAGAARLALVAVDDDLVVGHVLLSRGWVDDEERLAETLVLSPLSVHPGRQGEGLGTRLLAAALAAAGESGAAHVFLEGAPGFYGTRGFGPALDAGFLRPSERIPGPAFQVALLADDGARGRLVYPEAFWAHDAVGLRGETLRRVRASLEP